MNLLLAAGLATAALSPRRAVLVPSARGEARLFPHGVPEAAAREFALRYVLHFDNFTPATVEASTESLKRMVSARSWTQAAEGLDRRKQVAIEGRMASQVVPLSARVDGLRVEVEALRRTFIADKLSREARVTYRLLLERQPATDPNPWGLGLVGQEISESPVPPARKE